MSTRNVDTPPSNLASLFRGLYARVADRLGVDPSYVSRVARGERRSDAIEAAVEREMRQLLKHTKAKPQRSQQQNHNHNGTGRASKAATRAKR